VRRHRQTRVRALRQVLACQLLLCCSFCEGCGISARRALCDRVLQQVVTHTHTREPLFCFSTSLRLRLKHQEDEVDTKGNTMSLTQDIRGPGGVRLIACPMHTQRAHLPSTAAHSSCKMTFAYVRMCIRTSRRRACTHRCFEH